MMMDAADQPARGQGDDLAELIGQLIADRYRVDALLGAGGAGAVFRCRHVWLDTDVAIKVLHPELCDRPDVMRRFEQEARSASRLDHGNCVRVLDFGSWQGAGLPESKYLCMELLWGVELTRLLDQPLGPAFAVDVVAQMLDGLAHAHARGVVHRDVKPQNVVVVAGGANANVVKLVDFGIAKILGGEHGATRVTRECRVCGTPSYMSPEQVTGGPIDGRADLYAIGVLLHRMLAGRLPFESDDVRRVMQMHVTETPPPLPARTPEPLRRVVTRLLQKDPADRYEDAQLARAELLAAFTEARAKSAAPKPRRTLSDVMTLGPTFHAPHDRVRTMHDDRDPLPLRTAVTSRRRWPAWLRPSATAAALTAAAVISFLALEPASEPSPEPVIASAPPITALAAVGSEDVVPAVPSPLERARRLARSASTRGRALAAYDEALDGTPALLDDPGVFAELTALVRDPYLRGSALDLVLEHFGNRGGPLLVELLNTTLMPLAYEDRQRALAVIAHDSRLTALVDQRQLDALDLQDAALTDAPCVVFATALARIDKAADPLLLDTLARVSPPRTPLDADAATAGLCARLPGMLAATRARLERARTHRER